jgi:hypothetical protein
VLLHSSNSDKASVGTGASTTSETERQREEKYILAHRFVTDEKSLHYPVTFHNAGHWSSNVTTTTATARGKRID